MVGLLVTLPACSNDVQIQMSIPPILLDGNGMFTISVVLFAAFNIVLSRAFRRVVIFVSVCLVVVVGFQCVRLTDEINDTKTLLILTARIGVQAGQVCSAKG